MSTHNGMQILLAEADPREAKRLVQAIRPFSRTAAVATSGEQILELVRGAIFRAAIVGVELEIEDEPALVYLAGLPSMERLVAVGPGDEPETELQARMAGAQTYLSRPVSSRMLAQFGWINQRDRIAQFAQRGPPRY